MTLTREQVERYREELHKLFNHHSGVDALCDMAQASLDKPAAVSAQVSEPVRFRGVTAKEAIAQVKADQRSVPPQAAPAEKVAEPQTFHDQHGYTGKFANLLNPTPQAQSEGERLADELEKIPVALGYRQVKRDLIAALRAASAGRAK